MNIGEFISRLDGVRETKSGWAARCPAHQDRHPSLAINEGREGKILIKCFAGCSPEDVVDSPSLQMADLFPEGGET